MSQFTFVRRSATSSRVASVLAFSGALVFAAACSSDPATAPTAAIPGARSSVIPATGFFTGDTRTVQVCKDGSSPAGTYTYNVTRTGTVTLNDIFLGVTNNTLDAGSVTLTVSGVTACKEVYNRTYAVPEFPNNGKIDPGVLVTIDEQPLAGTTLANMTWQGFFGAPDPTGCTAAPCSFGGYWSVPTGTSTVYLNAYHSDIVTYFSIPVVINRGCTYTQGWYKNQGVGSLPAGNFFKSGQTYLQVLDTPPKGGNVYYQLAHQYIAARLNRNSASGTAAVDAALAGALVYFGIATPSATVPAGYTSAQLLAWASTLDSYNNGFTGPGHCG